jgi:hypothetical protein
MSAMAVAQRIVQSVRHLPQQARSPVRLPDQQTTAIAGDVSPRRKWLRLCGFYRLEIRLLPKYNLS